MKVKIETSHFERVKELREFLQDVGILLDAFENLLKYTRLEFVIETTRLVIK